MTMARQTLFGQAVLAARAQGLAIVLVTNNPRYAHLIGDRFLLLAGGQVAGNLTRDDVDADMLTAPHGRRRGTIDPHRDPDRPPPRSSGALTERRPGGSPEVSAEPRRPGE
jgi:ABC-type sugar transport system ATPase subunit